MAENKNNSYRSASPVERELLLALAGQEGAILDDNNIEDRILTSPQNTPQPQIPEAATAALFLNNTAFRNTPRTRKKNCKTKKKTIKRTHGGRRKIKGGNNDQKTPEKRQRRRQERRRERRRMGIITPSPPLSPQTLSPQSPPLIQPESPDYIPESPEYNPNTPSVASSVDSDIQDGIIAQDLANALNQQNLIHVEPRSNIVPPLRLPPPRLSSPPPANTPSNNEDTKNRPRVNIRPNRRRPPSDTKKSKLPRQRGGKKTRKKGGALSRHARVRRQLNECRRQLAQAREENTALRHRIAELINNPESHEGGKRKKRRKKRTKKGGMRWKRRPRITRKKRKRIRLKRKNNQKERRLRQGDFVPYNIRGTDKHVRIYGIFKEDGETYGWGKRDDSHPLPPVRDRRNVYVLVKRNRNVSLKSGDAWETVMVEGKPIVIMRNKEGELLKTLLPLSPLNAFFKDEEIQN